MKYDNQLRYAVNIIKDYDGRFPLAAWLKDFFKANKQMGSRDRKTVSELVYGYFRLGHNQFDSIENRLLAALYAGNQLPEIVTHFKTSRSAEELFAVDKIFPWNDLLSEGIDADQFAGSFLIRPDLFIRVRPGKENVVLEKLNASGIPYSRTGEDCIALPNSTKIDTILKMNEEAVVQDRSSQQTGGLLKNISFDTVWDCCAASGGKSIMMCDMAKYIDLTVSDIRESIMHNLRTRFKEAGIFSYNSFLADLSAPKAKLPDRQFDLIIADLPCTGSGTWSRTPEQLHFFKEERIGYYTKLQQQILHTILPKLAPGGHLLYITCSVFRQENEEMADKILLLNKNIRLVKKEMIKGYEDKADTMFAVLFTSAPVSE